MAMKIRVYLIRLCVGLDCIKDSIRAFGWGHLGFVKWRVFSLCIKFSFVCGCKITNYLGIILLEMHT